MASTKTLKYGPKISLFHVTMKGGEGGSDPFIVKDYEKGPFFAAFPKLQIQTLGHLLNFPPCFESITQCSC